MNIKLKHDFELIQTIFLKNDNGILLNHNVCNEDAIGKKTSIINLVFIFHALV